MYSVLTVLVSVTQKVTLSTSRHSQLGDLSACQKSVLHQLKSYGVLAAFHAIAAEEEAKQERKCKNCYFNAYGGECQLSCHQVDDEDTCERFSHVDDDHDAQ